MAALVAVMHPYRLSDATDVDMLSISMMLFWSRRLAGTHVFKGPLGEFQPDMMQSINPSMHYSSFFSF